MKSGKAHAYAQRWCWALVPNTGRNGSIGALSSKLCGFALAMFMMVVMMVAINRSIRVSTPANKPDAWFTAFEHDKEGMREWLHDCRYIYLDVGSNRGIQVRKIFEPDKYPNAAVLPVYREVFGKDWERRPEVSLHVCDMLSDDVLLLDHSRCVNSNFCHSFIFYV